MGQSPDHGHRRISDVNKAVEIFEDPARAAWQKPDQVVIALGLKKGQAVADIGAGTGYFSRRLAKAVGPSGKVYALDIEPTLVQYMRDRAAKEHQSNLIAKVVKPDDPDLAARSIDLVLIVNTLHHIEHRDRYYPKIVQALKQGGRLAIVDFYDHETPVGPPPEMRLSESAVTKELQQAGFTIQKKLSFLPYQYFLIATVKP